MTRGNSGKADFGDWTDPRRVAEYLSRELPFREAAEQLMLRALPAQVERFLDLGTGDGRLLELVQRAHPDAHGIGLDRSQPMLDRATDRFAGDPQVELRLHDLIEPLPKLGRVNAVVSGLAIHHLSDARKRSLFAEVRSILAPGGVFANLDLVASATPQRHRRFREEIGRTDDDPSDCLAGLAEQLDWLGEAGFGEVECEFKWLELTLIAAVRG